MKVGFYYSHEKDWKHHKRQNKDLNPIPEKYVTFAKRQITELLTQYGKIDLIWYDTPVHNHEDFNKMCAGLIRKHQPECIINGRIGNGLGDYKNIGDRSIVDPGMEGYMESIMTMRLNWGYDKNDDFWLLGSYYNSDATHILYSPYLIDFKMRASLTKFSGYYMHPISNFLVRGYFQYVKVSDGNEGNDFLFRVGKYFNPDLSAGYEFWYSNFKYVGADSPLYYSPENFNSHSLWFDYDLEKDAVAKLIIGGKVGYVPKDDFVSMEGHIDIFYRFTPQLSLNGNLSAGNTSREASDYSYFSASLAVYWGF